MSKAESISFKAVALGPRLTGMLLRAEGASPLHADELVFGIGLCLLSLVSLPAGKRGGKMKESPELIPTIFKAVALAMSVASILNVAPVQVHLILLGLGLFALSVAAVQKTRPGN